MLSCQGLANLFLRDSMTRPNGAIPSRLETRTKESYSVASWHIEMCKRNESELYLQ